MDRSRLISLGVLFVLVVTLLALGPTIVGTASSSLSSNPDYFECLGPGVGSQHTGDLIPFLYYALVALIGLGGGWAVVAGLRNAAVMIILGALALTGGTALYANQVSSVAYAATSTCLQRDGSLAMTGDLSLGGNDITNALSLTITGTSSYLLLDDVPALGNPQIPTRGNIRWANGGSRLGPVCDDASCTNRGVALWNPDDNYSWMDIWSIGGAPGATGGGGLYVHNGAYGDYVNQNWFGMQNSGGTVFNLREEASGTETLVPMTIMQDYASTSTVVPGGANYTYLSFLNTYNMAGTGPGIRVAATVPIVFYGSVNELQIYQSYRSAGQYNLGIQATTSAVTAVDIVPGSGATRSIAYFWNGSDIANAGYVSFDLSGTTMTIGANKTGGGTAPLQINIGPTYSVTGRAVGVAGDSLALLTGNGAFDGRLSIYTKAANGTSDVQRVRVGGGGANVDISLMNTSTFTWNEGLNVVLGTSTGTKIGTASTQLLGFWNVTPVDQPETIADPSGGGTQDAEARAAIATVIDRLQELGLIK